ncbi:related to protein involved in ribosomal RNA processing, component of the exosome complex responsible [Cephalotrichum gorgonifer]|uniref:Ribosomal RNA-processing protein 40 n=1 Tax=Cephalotrichum gorgonifer TaxID=2041049 RepID=A0AAE8MVG4_9PEZI|nr:related to protein involved in ribosomal RNA processing, component of the exosome complex responsible [Cephalotrichum gorgonifer]
MARNAVYVLPGDEIDESLIPQHPKNPLRIGPGLRLVPPSDLIPTLAGALLTDKKKNSIWVEQSAGRYLPNVGDLVIGAVTRSAAELYHVSLSDYAATATLPHLSFELATKKTKPNLNAGALVYARVTLANKHMDPELECVSQATGKADGLGPLVGGMVFKISLGMSRRLLMNKSVEEGKVVVLEELENGGLAFETAVGRNGRVWVNSEDVATVIAVGKAIVQTDEHKLGVDQQKKLVRKILNSR